MFTPKVTALSLAPLFVAAALVAQAAPPAGTGKPANPGPPAFVTPGVCVARPNDPNCTIQAAVDGGCTNITVEPGTYNENVHIPAPWTYDEDGNYIPGSRTVTITGTAGETIVDGGGIFNWDGVVRLYDSLVTRNTAVRAGGIYSEGTLMLDSNSSVEGNTPDDIWGTYSVEP